MKFNFLALLLGITIVAAEVRPETLLFCLNPSEKLLELKDGKIKNGTEMATLFSDFAVSKVERWLPGAADSDHQGDIYLNRIYRLYLPKNGLGKKNELQSRLSALSSIHSTEVEYQRKPYFTPNDPQRNSQWYLAQVNAYEAWDVNMGDENVLLASVDTGVWWRHEDLVDNLWQNLGEDADGDGHVLEYLGGSWQFDPGDENGIDDDGNGYIDDLIGWDSSGYNGMPDNDPNTPSGVSYNGTWSHGTHVAGLLSATTNNGIGIASVAFSGKIISVKTSLGSQGYPYVNDGYPGILYAAQAAWNAGNMCIVNCSWGGEGWSNYEQTVVNTAHETYGAVIVGAGGNGNDYGAQEYAAHYPSSYDNVISVCPTGTNDEWHNWATYHETIDLASPGENIRSTLISDHYASWAGSSMASPLAASCIGLMKAQNPNWTNNQLIKMAIETSNPRIYDVNPAQYLAGRLGHGRVDAEKAVITPLFPSIEFLELTDTPSGDDYTIHQGETAEVLVVIGSNPEWGDAFGINATLSTEASCVDIVGPNTVFEDMPAGEASLNFMQPFYVTFPESCAPGNYDFNVHITSNEDEWVLYETDLPLVLELFESECSGQMGDVNLDGDVDVLDVVSVVNHIISGTELSDCQFQAADMNGDETINVQDLVLIVNDIMN